MQRSSQSIFLMLYMSSVKSPFAVPNWCLSMPSRPFLLTLLATCTQCLLNEKKVSRYTPSNLGLWTSVSSESAILIFGRVLACAGSGVNKVTDDFGADIKREFSHRNRDISVK